MIEDIEFGKEIILGIFIGGLFIILNVAFGLVIGIPSLAFSSEAEKYIIRDAIAPVAEELAFRALLPFMLAIIGLPIVLIAIIDITAFSIFHFAAYGSSIVSANALFIGAGVFALVTFLVTYYESDPNEFQVPLAAIIGHAIINIWLGIKQSGLIVVSGI